MERCDKYENVKNVKKTIENIRAFCQLLRSNKVKDSKAAFQKLPQAVQCMFLEHGWQILSNKNKYSDDSYSTSFKLFKLFRSKDMKSIKTYEKYNRNSTENSYKKALEWNRSQSPKKSKGSNSSESPGRGRKKYDKEFQKYEAPKEEHLDPLYIFYTSLYSQNSKSRLAITWLTEHGVYDGEERKNLVKKYEKLKEQNKLIK